MGADIVPDGCRWCGEPGRGHGRRWVEPLGWHAWASPTGRQRLARMLARRRMRHYPGTGALIEDLTQMASGAHTPKANPQTD